MSKLQITHPHYCININVQISPLCHTVSEHWQFLQDEIPLVHILLDVGAQPRMYYGYEYVREETFADAAMWKYSLEFCYFKTFDF